MKPEKKLRLLKHYMNLWIDNYPNYKLSSFEIFLHQLKEKGKSDSKQTRESQKLKLNYKNACQYCERHFSYVEKTDDHIIPYSKGGRRRNNITNACSECNNWKGNKDLSEWLIVLTEYFLAGRYKTGYGGKRIEKMLINIRKLQELTHKRARAA
jgi:hypothetical protein